MNHHAVPNDMPPSHAESDSMFRVSIRVAITALIICIAALCLCEVQEVLVVVCWLIGQEERALKQFGNEWSFLRHLEEMEIMRYCPPLCTWRNQGDLRPVGWKSLGLWNGWLMRKWGKLITPNNYVRVVVKKLLNNLWSYNSSLLCWFLVSTCLLYLRI